MIEAKDRANNKNLEDSVDINAHRNQRPKGQQQRIVIPYDLGDEETVNLDKVSATSAIIPLCLAWGTKFYLTSTVTQLLNLKGLLGSAPRNDPNLYLINFVGIILYKLSGSANIPLDCSCFSSYYLGNHLYSWLSF